MPFPLIPLALMGGSALASWFSNKGKNKPATTTTTSTPTLDPAFAGLQGAILPNIMNRLNQKSYLPAGLSEINTGDINETYQNAQVGLDNQLSARGLSTSPIAGAADARLAGSRASEISRMKNTLPILNEEMRRQSLLDALQALSLGRQGNTTISTGMPGGGSAVGSGISSAASMLGFLFGSGMLGNSAGAPKSSTGLSTGILGNSAPFQGLFNGIGPAQNPFGVRPPTFNG